MSEPQRPVATANEASTTEASAGSKMAGPKPVNPIGVGGTAAQAQAGQTLDKMGISVVTEPPASPGPGGNLASDDVYATTPNIVGPASGTRPGVQNPTMGQTVGAHAVGAGVVKGGLPPGIVATPRGRGR